MFFCNNGEYDEQTFSHISSDESTQYQQSNEHSANEQPEKGEEQKSKDSTKHETTLCATCKKYCYQSFNDYGIFVVAKM